MAKTVGETRSGQVRLAADDVKLVLLPITVCHANINSRRLSLCVVVVEPFANFECGTMQLTPYSLSSTQSPNADVDIDDEANGNVGCSEPASTVSYGLGLDDELSLPCKWLMNGEVT